ncbi:MAG: DUF6263 family protein [Bacteroidota bacterium]
MIKDRIVFSLIFYIILFFTSCKIKDEKNSAINTNQLFFLNFFPKDSIKLQYDNTAETEIEREINGEKTNVLNKIETGFIYKIKKDTTNTYAAILQYNKFKVYVKSNETDKELDANSAINSYDPADRVLSVFKGAVISAIINSQGKVKSLAGIKEINDKMYALSGDDPRSIEALKSFSKQYASEDFFIKTIEQNFRYYPSKSINIGDSWEQDDTVKSYIILPIKTIYKLKSIEDGIATLSLSSNIEIKNQILQDIGTTANIEGKQEGEIKIDIRKGYIQKSLTSLKLKGEIDINGIEVPIRISMKDLTVGKILN